MWYSCRATCSLVSLMAMTEPAMWAKRTTCREMPRGSAARFSAGQSSSVTCHGRSSSSGSAVAAVMFSEPSTLAGAASVAAASLADRSRGSLPFCSKSVGSSVQLAPAEFGHGVNSSLKRQARRPGVPPSLSGTGPARCSARCACVQSPRRRPDLLSNRCTWPCCGRTKTRVALHRGAAAVDAGHDVVVLAVQGGVAVDVGVRAEFLDHVHLHRQAFAVGRRSPGPPGGRPR